MIVLKEKMPWLYSKRGDIITINGQNYTVRLNSMNDIIFLKQGEENYIFFADKNIVIKDEDIENADELQAKSYFD